MKKATEQELDGTAKSSLTLETRIEGRFLENVFLANL